MHLIRRPLAPLAGLVAALVSALVALVADRRARPAPPGSARKRRYPSRSRRGPKRVR